MMSFGANIHKILIKIKTIMKKDKDSIVDDYLKLVEKDKKKQILLDEAFLMLASRTLVSFEKAPDFVKEQALQRSAILLKNILEYENDKELTNDEVANLIIDKCITICERNIDESLKNI